MSFLSPYLVAHVKRFGDYNLKLKRPPEDWIRDTLFQAAANAVKGLQTRGQQEKGVLRDLKARMPFASTPYGNVDAKALKSLRASFDTSAVLGFVDQIDAMKTRLNAADGLRTELLQLHSMIAAVLRGEHLGLNVEESELQESALSAVDELLEMADQLRAGAALLKPFTMLSGE